MAWIDAETAARLVGSTVRLANYVTMEFRSATIRLWTGAHATRLDGDVYIPVGVFGAISGLDAPIDGTSEPFTLELSGVHDGNPIFGVDVLASVAAERTEASGRNAVIRMRLMDDDWQPVGAAVPIRRGVMQRARIVRTDGDTPQRTIGMECEDVWSSRARQAAGRFNDADQNSRYAGDRFFRFVSNQAARPAVWPDF